MPVSLLTFKADMSDPLTQILQLIELSKQENLDEARNAALAAVRLIVKYRIVLLEPAPNLGMSFPEPPSAKIRIRKSKPQASNGDGFRKLKSKYDGVCKWCRLTIKKNTQIYWNSSLGAYHLKCFKESEG